MENDLKHRIETARGLRKADLVLKGGSILNVFTGETEQADVAIVGDRIAGIGSYLGKKVVDVRAKLILPGFMDSHVHIESTMLAPAEFAAAAIRHGTTAVVADPHEIANVLGKRGIRSMLGSTVGLPLDFYFMLPSCVPASELETSGARLNAADLAFFSKHERVLGLAEVMDYPGVLSGTPDLLGKLMTFSSKSIDGHAPRLSGKDLAAYVAAGITTDHECTTADEAREKVRMGMTVFIREGSAARNLKAILPAVTRHNSRFFCFATDDMQPGDLLVGGINLIIRKAIALGLDPVTATRMATLNPSRHYNLRNRGAIAPGYQADLVVIDDFKKFNVEKVFKSGRLAARKGKGIPLNRSAVPGHQANTIKIKSLSLEDLALKTRTGHARIIELIPDQIETKQKIMPIIVDNGMVANDRDRDIAKLIVVERHKASGRIGIGLVKGFGLKSGAFASTVAHDSHNIIAVGTYDSDILAAVKALKQMKGGLVVVKKEKILAALPLPVAGLMSDRSLNYVVKQQNSAVQAVRKLGVKLKAPFATLSFLALPVIPELKLTDRGLVDVKEFKLVDLFV